MEGRDVIIAWQATLLGPGVVGVVGVRVCVCAWCLVLVQGPGYMVAVEPWRWPNRARVARGGPCHGWGETRQSWRVGGQGIGRYPHLQSTPGTGWYEKA